MKIHKYLFIGFLLMVCLVPLQGQKRMMSSLGFEMEFLPGDLERVNYIFKKQMRFEYQFPLTKRLSVDAGLRFSWTAKEFSRIDRGNFWYEPVKIYAFSKHTFALPVGLSFGFDKNSMLPLSVYGNVEPVLNKLHYDDLNFEIKGVQETALAYEGGIRFPFYNGENMGGFFAPYIRFQGRIVETKYHGTPPEDFVLFEKTFMKIVGIRAGIALY